MQREKVEKLTLNSEEVRFDMNTNKVFEQNIVEYLPENLCTYASPEYKGKPYFSIKYKENGEHFVGYGTYKPEILSEYLKKYFIKERPA